MFIRVKILDCLYTLARRILYKSNVLEVCTERFIYRGTDNGMGIKMGKLSTLEERGRILIPKSLRDELKLKPGQKLLVERRGSEIVFKPTIDLKKFSSELKGCVKKSKIKPKEVKRIWQM